MKKKHKKPASENSESKEELIHQEKNKKKAYKKILRFVLIFLGLLTLFSLLFSLTANNLLYPPCTKLVIATTRVVGLVLNFLGMETQVKQQFLTLENFGIEVVVECTGLHEIFIFLAAILAYPANLKKKFWGVLLGIPFIFLVNIVRMVFITAISNYKPSAFQFLHLYFWQVTLIMIILCAWILWIEKIVKSEKF
jgi:archaeosortase B (VPXXXP-CTERM-specific)